MVDTITPWGMRNSAGQWSPDPSHAAWPDQYARGVYRQGLDAAARGRVHIPSGNLVITVDLPLDKISNMLRAFGREATQSTELAEALNHTRDKFHTWIKGKVQQWTGIRLQNMAAQSLRKKNASPGDMTAAVIVIDRHRKITQNNFSARFGGRYQPVTHTGWGGSRAFGAFMFPSGSHSYLAFKRVVPGHRGKLKPLYGPNAAVEAKKHEGEVRANLNAFVQIDLAPRLLHNLRRAAAAAGGWGVAR